MSVDSLLAALRVSPPMKPLQAWPCAWQAPAVKDASAWARAQLAALGPAIMEAQLRLYAHQRQSVLVVLQGMDTSGKDGLIRRVFTHVNPVGLRVQSFRAPNAAEQRHHFLWRACRGLPEPGCISVYNRSYYEEVMYLRVHPEQRPQVIEDKDIVGTRLLQINRFEADLERRG
ncbi:MAG: polyphosphate kinase 2 family protein, partial [Pseudomonadota bacterium]